MLASLRMCSPLVRNHWRCYSLSPRLMWRSSSRESLSRHLYFVQNGMIVPWQYPYSELSSPFLIGDHEFMMGAERWVASYSAATQATVVAIPVATMRLVS